MYESAGSSVLGYSRADFDYVTVMYLKSCYANFFHWLGSDWLTLFVLRNLLFIKGTLELINLLFQIKLDCTVRNPLVDPMLGRAIDLPPGSNGLKIMQTIYRRMLAKAKEVVV